MRTLARGMALASFIGVPFAVLVSFGALAGHALDRRLGTSPWLLLGGLVLGAVAAFLNMMRVLRKLEQLDESWEQRRAEARAESTKVMPSTDASPPDAARDDDTTPTT